MPSPTNQWYSVTDLEYVFHLRASKRFILCVSIPHLPTVPHPFPLVLFLLIEYVGCTEYSFHSEFLLLTTFLAVPQFAVWDLPAQGRWLPFGVR